MQSELEKSRLREVWGNCSIRLIAPLAIQLVSHMWLSSKAKSLSGNKGNLLTKHSLKFIQTNLDNTRRIRRPSSGDGEEWRWGHTGRDIRSREQGAGSRDKGATNQSGGISITARALELFLVPVPIPISSNYNVFCFIYVTGHTGKTETVGFKTYLYKLVLNSIYKDYHMNI